MQAWNERTVNRASLRGEPAAEDGMGPVRNGVPTAEDGMGPEGGRKVVAETELAALDRQFDSEEPGPELARRVIEWATGRFGSAVALACSFQDCVIVDLAAGVEPGIEVIFLDTGYHFPETLQFVDEVKRLYKLNLTITRPGDSAIGWPCGTQRCCEVRKIEPLMRAMEGKAAWITALKRCDSPTRSDIPIVSLDAKFAKVKINPLASWSDNDIAAYIDQAGLPVHPLTVRGYPSIGCAPVTAAVEKGAHPRSGRWAGTGKTECGLHA